MFKISDLRNKDIINLADGKRMGGVRDIEVDMEEGEIKAIILPSNTRFWGIFMRNDEIVIPWHNIEKIGEDVVLIRLSDNHLKDDYAYDAKRKQGQVEEKISLPSYTKRKYDYIDDEKASFWEDDF